MNLGPRPDDPIGSGPAPVPGEAVVSADSYEVGRLQDELAAERAGLEYWRGVAEQRSNTLAVLRGRPAVRLALAADRRTARVVDEAARRLDHAQRRIGRLRLTVEGVAARVHIGARRAEVAAAGPLPPVGDSRSVTTIVTTVARDQTSAVSRRFAEARTDMVCLRRSSVVPSDPAWLDHLLTGMDEGVGAVVPLVVHSKRPWTRATPLDLLVREAGLQAELRPDGEPVLRFRDAGRAVTEAEAGDVVAATASCILFDRRAAQRVGGLDSSLDLDAAVIDLCLRLRASGRRIRTVTRVVMTDDRPVVERHELWGPLADSGPGWRSLIERHGSALRRDATGPAPGADSALTFALTVASPSAKVARQWGDWHLAEALARSLERAGHEVLVQNASQADSLNGRSADVHVVLRGLVPVRATPGQVHVLWIISHPEAVESSECDEADLVIVASYRFAAALRQRTSTPVEVLLQATDPQRFHPRPVDPSHRHDVTVVAKSRDVLRPMVADALAAGIRPAIYGSGWEGLVDRSLVVASDVDNADLPVVYSSAAVVLNDHWETMRTWGFVSNRVFDVLACGTPLVSDQLPELAELFGDLVATWRTPDELRAAVSSILADPSAAGVRAAEARRIVLAHHTFDHRARELTALLADLGLPGGVVPLTGSAS